MIELLEKVCDNMRDYGTTTDPATGRRGYTRINTRPGESLTITNVNLSSGGSEELTNAVSPNHFTFNHWNQCFSFTELPGEIHGYTLGVLFFPPSSATMLLRNMRTTLLISMETVWVSRKLRMNFAMRSQVTVQSTNTLNSNLKNRSQFL